MNYRDVAERVVWTFVQSFLGAILVAAAFDVSAAKAAAFVGLTSVAALVKNLAAKRLAELPPVE